MCGQERQLTSLAVKAGQPLRASAKREASLLEWGAGQRGAGDQDA